MPDERYFYYTLAAAGLTAVCVGAFIHIFSNENFTILREDYALTTKFGKLVIEHGTYRKALSHLASELDKIYAEQRDLQARNQLTDEQKSRLRRLDWEIPDVKRDFWKTVAIANEWGVSVPEKSKYKDWILPGDRLEPAVTEAAESGTSVAA